MASPVTLHLLTPERARWLEGCAVFDFPPQAERIAAFLNDPGHLMILARAQETVVGFVSGTVLLHPDKAPAFFVNEIAVDPDWQRLGIGQRLLDAIRQAAFDRGCETLWVATDFDNEAARRLYLTAGGAESEGVVVYAWQND